MKVDVFPNTISPDNDKSMPGHISTGSVQDYFETGDIILDRYEIECLLGEGGMGVVYKCYDKTSCTRCALKTLRPEFALNGQAHENVRSNFRLVHNLHHDNIASYNSLEYDASRKMFYLIMEYVDGEPIDCYIKKMRKKGSFSEKLVIDLCKKAAAALDFAHDHKVLHCDIKPSNIMIDKNGNVKIVDFGLASANHNTISYVNNSNSACIGTPNYMAPEQWRGDDKCCSASDQYSLAATVYEMFSGRVPFSASNIEVLRESVLHDKPVPLKDVSPAISYAITKALNKVPARRYRSCSEFVAALERNVWLEISKSLMHELWILCLKSEKKLKDLCKEIFKHHLVRWGMISLLLGVLLMIVGKIFFEWDFYLWDIVFLPLLMLIFCYLIKMVISGCKKRDHTESYIGLVLFILFGSGVLLYCRSLTFKALHGDILAMTQIAEDAENPEDAAKWYKAAARKGDSYSQYCYAAYLLAKQDDQKAFQWFGAAANQELARAQYELGNCYYNGTGTPKDRQQALYWWKKSAAQGVNDAFKVVVKEYIEKNQIVELTEFVRNKSVFEQGKIFYDAGIYWKNNNDNKSAANYLIEGYKLNNPLSILELAKLYRTGYGVPHDHTEALKLFEKACDLNVKEAPFYCGDYYENGSIYGLTYDPAKAFERYKDGAALNDPQAKLRLADVLLYGKLGVTQNYNRAFELYDSIEFSGIADAVFKLGLCHWFGYGCKQNITRAGDLFKKAVNMCSYEGEYWFYLGLYYKEVKAYDEDTKKAFTRAYELGCKQAKDYL